MSEATSHGVLKRGQVRRHHRTGLRVQLVERRRDDIWAVIYPDHTDRDGKRAQRKYRAEFLQRYYPIQPVQGEEEK